MSAHGDRTENKEFMSSQRSEDSMLPNCVHGNKDLDSLGSGTVKLDNQKGK